MVGWTSKSAENGTEVAEAKWGQVASYVINFYYPDMVRPLRVEFESAWCHVMNRGTAREDVFVVGKQRHPFLELLED